MCYERTRDQGTLGSITIPVIVEPLGRHFLYTYRLGHVGGLLRYSSGSRDPADRLGRGTIKSTKEYEGSI
jgi:hypothetical protein